MKATVLEYDRVRRSIDGPAWRWQCALELAELRGSGGDRDVDDVMHHAAGFMRIMNSGADSVAEARHKYPLIAQAKSLWDKPHSWQQFVIMALGGFTKDAMSAKLNVKAEVVDVAERLFFDIRDSRQACSWINLHVIMPEFKAKHFELAGKYRQAYYGGAKVAEWILDGGKGIAGDSTEQLEEQRQLLQMKCLAALEMPLTNSQEAVEFLKINLEFQHKMKRLEFDEEKLRTQVEQERRKHELAELRHRDTERRHEQKRQSAQEKNERRQQVKNDHQRLASIQASLDRQRQYSEQQKRIERANHTPLAGLLWTRTTTAAMVVDAVNKPRGDKEYVAA